ncbi:MAG: hypothetical protein L3J52_03815, partial [Proteobacteria bacterium]|nr:hypothetical protein [Pseudomonadota bacterium]
MKNLALLMLFLLFSWHVFAQPETNKTADPEVEVIKSDLTKPGLSKPISPKLILDELRDGLSSLKADFIQYELKEDNS